jgi:hypothetical protein
MVLAVAHLRALDLLSKPGNAWAPPLKRSQVSRATVRVQDRRSRRSSRSESPLDAASRPRRRCGPPSCAAAAARRRRPGDARTHGVAASPAWAACRAPAPHRSVRLFLVWAKTAGGVSRSTRMNLTSKQRSLIPPRRESFAHDLAVTPSISRAQRLPRQPSGEALACVASAMQ